MPPCPVCGGLECLCRPRFFAGQLLSEEDLRALDHYVIEKNKLHNRYLHGWGVVCGLEVLCHECKGWVNIKQGYALDPCGNDIIVCKDYPFDVCAAINKCCDRKRKDWECEPMAGPPPDCSDVPQCWYITLRYREFESRGITALKSSSQSSGCGCGASDCRGGCGCGSHNGNGHGAKKRAGSYARRPAPQCEPTRTCESFVVELAPAPLEGGEDPLKLFAGTFLEQVLACAKEFDALYQSHEDLKTYKTRVWEFVRHHPLKSCQLASDITSPNTTSNNLDIAIGQLFRDCVCRALLPPCPSDPFDPRVVLACVTVKNDAAGCSIINICHQRGRRFVLTAPNLLYWFSFGGWVKQVLENVCCKEGTPEPPPPPQKKANLGVVTTATLSVGANEFKCTITVHNDGPDEAENVVVDATVTSSVPEVQMKPNHFNINLGSLPVDETRETGFGGGTVGMSLGPPVTFTVTATVKSDATDPHPSDNTQTVEVIKF